LAKDKIYSKIVSVPCQDIFDQQSKLYKKKILGETKYKVSIEAASTDCWRKYVGTEGLTFGIDTFGKSAPYKEIYKHFGLTVENISKKTKNLIKS
jgi:transketolase